MTCDSRAAKIVETLTRHLDHWNDTDIRFAARELISTDRWQGESKIKRFSKPWIRSVLQSPN